MARQKKNGRMHSMILNTDLIEEAKKVLGIEKTTAAIEESLVRTISSAKMHRFLKKHAGTWDKVNKSSTTKTTKKSTKRLYS